jgi:hypothetical protein
VLQENVAKRLNSAHLEVLIKKIATLALVLILEFTLAHEGHATMVHNFPTQ